MTLFLTLPPDNNDSIEIVSTFKVEIESDDELKYSSPTNDNLPIDTPKLVRQSGYIKDELKIDIDNVDDLSKPKLQRQIAYYKTFVFSPMVRIPYKEVMYSPVHYNIYDDDIILL